ncbi:MAG: AsmA family protein, partial [Planctomycetota bacterium]
MKVTTSIKLILAGLALIAVGVAVKVIAFQTSPEEVREAVLSELADAVSAHVSLASARFGLDGVLHASGLSVTLPGLEEPALECPAVRVTFDRFELLRLRQLARKVLIVSPTIRLSYSDDDQMWNVARVTLNGGGGGRKKAAGGLPEEILVEDATLVVRNATFFGDEKPRVYEGLHIALKPDEAGIGQWLVEARILKGPLRGTHISGWMISGRRPRFGLEIDARALRADHVFWRHVPFGELVWRDYRPAGRLAVRGSLTSRGRGPLDYSFKAELTDAEARTKFFPVDCRSVNGLVEVAGETLVVRDVTAVIPAKELDDAALDRSAARVRVSGTCRLGDGSGSFQIEVGDLPLCETTVSAIPGAGEELWSRLRPSGRAQLTLGLTGEPGAPMRFHAVTELSGAVLHPAELPVPLREVSGVVAVDSKGVRLRRLRGLLGEQTPPGAAAGTFEVDGHLDFERRDSLLAISLRSLRSNEALTRAIPGAGEQLWDLFHPEVDLDASVLLRDAPETDRMSSTVVVDLHGGRAELRDFPLPLRDLAGTVRVEDGKVFIEQLSALLGPAEEEEPHVQTTSAVEVRGTVDLAAQQARLHLAAPDLMLSEQLLTSIPNVGPRIWQQAAPEGMASVEARIHYANGAGRPLRYVVDMNLRDVSITPALIPLPINALAGQLLLNEDQAISNSFAGITCGGHFSGAAVVYYGGEGDLPSYGARLRFDQLDLSDLLECFTGERKDLSGRIMGVLDIGGIVGRESSRAGRGTLNLTEGHLWHTPLFAKLLPVLHLRIPTDGGASARGQMIYTLSGDQISVHEFELTGGGLNLSGYGTV